VGFRIALHSVSYAGFFYNGPPLTLEEIIKRARMYGYEGIELMAKRPHALPCDLTAKDRKRIKELFDSNGLSIPIIASYTNFADPSTERRDKELVYMKDVIELARDLDVNKIRVFAAGMTQLDPRHDYFQYWRWCKGCLIDSARFAEDAGVMLGLQNHPPLMESYLNVLDMIEEVGSPALKAIIDPPLLSSAKEPIEKAVKESAKVLLHHVHVSDKDSVRVGRSWPTFLGKGIYSEDLKKWFRIAKTIGYDGWISYEVCEPVYEKHELAPLSKIDALVKEAALFLKQVITEVSVI